MPMLKNATKNLKTYRERGQPVERQELGLLEKKKDYRLRARDQNKKRRILEKLRERALDRNPDEYYHHMVNSRMIDGVHREMPKEESENLTVDQIRLMQERDLRYVISRRTMERRRIGRMQSNLHLLSVNDVFSSDEKAAHSVQRNKHTFFVDTEEEKKNFDLAHRLNTHPSMTGRVHNRLLVDQLVGTTVSSLLNQSQTARDNMAVARVRNQSQYVELSQRVAREKRLSLVQSKMEAKRDITVAKKLGSLPKRIVVPETRERAPVYQWPMERKR